MSPATAQPTVETVVNGRNRSHSASISSTFVHKYRGPSPLNGQRPPSRLPSPLLTADFGFRESHLIEHYFNYSFKLQFYNGAIKRSTMPNIRLIQTFIQLNPALRHACCALAALTFPSHPPPSQREILAHHGLAIAFLGKTVVANFFDESMLLAIVELLDYEVSSLYTYLIVAKILTTFGLAYASRRCAFRPHLSTFYSNRSRRLKFLPSPSLFPSKSYIPRYLSSHSPRSSSCHVPTTHP
jgi:hypothetical protein